MDEYSSLNELRRFESSISDFFFLLVDLREEIVNGRLSSSANLVEF